MIQNIIIIEDEEQSYRRLEKILKQILPEAKILVILSTVISTIKWLDENAAPDLIFMDINLADGLSFEVLKQRKIVSPIIFTTAHDEYAIDAFKVNSIDYLLKPIDKEDVMKAINKMRTLQSKPSSFVNFNDLLQSIIPQRTKYRERFMIKIGETIKSINIIEIAYFYTENKATYVVLKNVKKYPIDFNLDQLESMLDPKDFFRINRQFIICMFSIEDMKNHTRGRVTIKLNPPIKLDSVVSIERSHEFRKWIGGD